MIKDFLNIGTLVRQGSNRGQIRRMPPQIQTGENTDALPNPQTPMKGSPVKNSRRDEPLASDVLPVNSEGETTSPAYEASEADAAMRAPGYEKYFFASCDISEQQTSVVRQKENLWYAKNPGK
jgi:hypothetical protein